MILQGFERKVPIYKVLSEEQVATIHAATLETLKSTGVRFLDKKAIETLRNAGCEVVDNDRVLFPEWLVEDSINKCPSSFHLQARDPSQSLQLGGNRVYFSSFPGMRTVDLDTWEPRVATHEEQDNGVKVLNSLPNLHFLTPYTPYFEIKGVPPAMCILETTASQIRNTSKISRVGYQKESERFAIQMAQAVNVDILCSVFASSPLTYYGESIQALFRFVEAGFPIHVTSGGVMGGTLPATIAGATIVHNAELIAGIVLIQLLRPGHGIVVNSFVNPMNMNTGNPSFGTIESSLHSVVFNQIWRHYDVPINNSLSGCVNSKKIDYQCGIEKSIPALISALSGANGVHLHGAIHAELTFHPVQAIVDDDVAGMIGRFLKGVQIDDETLAINLIDQVGSIPGHYLGQAHTRQWWKSEQFMPAVADRTPLNDEWAKEKNDIVTNARKHCDHILKTHEPLALSAEADKDISRILKDARKFYTKMGEI